MRVDEREFSKLVSPYDVLDYKFTTAVSEDAFPEVFELPGVSVKNQGSTSSCVAHACSSIIEYHNTRQEGSDVVFSTEFIYGYRPFGYYVGKGMFLRNALRTIQKIGDCPVADFKGNHEYKEAMSNVKAKEEELKQLAYPHRISSYARVRTVADIKKALMDYGYVLVSMPWHVDYKLKDGVYTYSSKKKRGYHAVVIYGWNEKGWLVQNSWGKGWGRNGKFIVPFNFKWTEAWAILDNITSDNAELIKPAENWFIRTFSPIINYIVNIFRKLFKKV